MKRKEKIQKLNILKPSERECDFSLRSRLIRQSDSLGARRKVALGSKAYAWAPVLRSFDKLREVGFYPTCFTLDLRNLLMFSVGLRP